MPLDADHARRGHDSNILTLRIQGKPSFNPERDRHETVRPRPLFRLPMWKKTASRCLCRPELLDLWDKQLLRTLLDQERISPEQARELNEIAMWIASADAARAAAESDR